jgi:hypothetical protein
MRNSSQRETKLNIYIKCTSTYLYLRECCVCACPYNALEWEVFISRVSARGTIVQYRKKTCFIMLRLGGSMPHNDSTCRQKRKRTPWSRLFEKLVVSYLVTFSTFYGTRSFITAFKRSHHLSKYGFHFVQQINPVHTIPSYVFTIRFNIVLPSNPTSSKLPICCSFPSKTTYDFLFSHMPCLSYFP